MKRIILIGGFLICCQVPLLAQVDTRAIVLPDAQMEPVVKQILMWYFHAPKKPKTIYIAAYHIKKEWLPHIHNIKFVVVDNPANGILYFFRYGEWHGDRRLTLNFAYGDAACSAKGDTWSVSIRGSRVRLRLVSTKWLISCSLEDLIYDPM
ncbi:MAG: hypothetical protein IPL32_16715 [Chloracidobacterium sp.]|nr:hypothetical protein [Chloracidobacterium sp.]